MDGWQKSNDQAHAAFQQGDLQTALQGFTDAAKALLSDSADQPSSPLMSTLAIVFSNIGALHGMLKQRERARQAYQEAERL